MVALWSKKVCPFPSVKVKICPYTRDCVTDPKARARGCPLIGADYFFPEPIEPAQRRAKELQYGRR